MSISIRKFLLINLLLAMTLVISLMAVGNYFLGKQDVEQYLDDLLGQAGLSFTAIASRDIRQQNWTLLQQKINALPAQAERYHTNSEGKYRFQIWSKTHQLLLHSFNAPETMLSSGKLGFTDIVVNGMRYRVFSNYDLETQLTFIVAEPYSDRDHLAHKIMADNLYILLLTYPLASILIWVIIGRGLGSVGRIADALGAREPNYLEPVSLKGVPLEIQPLIQELNKLFFRLQEAFDREKRFASDAAHELRTPLAAIRTQAQVALMVAASPEQSVVLQNVILGVDRATHIVNQLLAMSRLADHEQVQDFTVFQFVPVAQDVIHQLVGVAAKKGITLSFECNDKVVNVLGNAAALHILVRNLVDNAIRYSFNDKPINVSLLKKEKTVELTVADYGPGIPEEYRERVFERFFRILGNTSPGSGLGLSIVKQIVDLHHAKMILSFTDEVNKSGLTVKITFPLPA